MRGSKHITAVMVVAMLTVAMVPGTVGAASTDALQVGVTQDAETGNATVTVTRNSSAVENATVLVESSGNYTGNGTYETDANGTVELPNPSEHVNATFTVTEGNNTTTESVDLIPLDESLDITVEADDANDTITATVTQYGEAVEGASVQVNGTSYDNGTYETDANGTVSVAEPTTTTNLTFVATDGNLTAESTISVEADDLGVSVAQDSNASVTITVTEDGEPVENASVTVSGNYTDAGEYETDANGTVDLSAPLQTVTVDVTAEHNDQTAETTVTLEGEVAEDDPFGQLVSSFVERLKDSGFDGPMGQAVSDFVTENNPGNADDKRPDHAGPKNKTDDTSAGDDAPGKSDNADKRGPPEHANSDKKDAETESTEEESDSDDSDEETAEEDDKRGPPEDAGPKNK
ncbi:hypothetical protein E6P09_12145 [Haloferax mediterranei ATCC 33500]|uniref:Uncharacterized protein n=1 Tax=Haloferax mediterranei (strain ATCC 33500 / DSM 1411 / JCM 8866 / NBRC 14739 / NCIMB 2177 / R-4) TaxID=523841 RepID=I3R8N7_HALMT|nr:hypothetical protein [Haloferax mediterranei]AFK20597.1 hypothetical protein HFX_2928 [Haloferax mediterranei ATCC 33500]AHZ23951.1 hypothetical protein BM92_15445 [Haloferax mediterranei ATCC 33500]ELZ98379.1 hypothetical protein C439_16380 [Haloferax mediterranei ATCC 33500]MDX5986648.1 hypothetical protein [Haloferax mediterranei ATCC 33500]QCQ75980.1 hypothetical protein E6P09_12145 [Haloferax mediterranei ATCC 33500]